MQEIKSSNILENWSIYEKKEVPNILTTILNRINTFTEINLEVSTKPDVFVNT